MKNTTVLYSRTWLRVFYHNIEFGSFPEDKSLCRVSDREGMFNAIGKLNDIFKINGKYEFMLDYKENGSIVWQQALLPTEIKKENTSDVEGLKILFNNPGFSYFAGLKISNVNSSCFDGSSRDLTNHRYSVGIMQGDSIPGYLDQNANGFNVKEVALWIRIPSERLTMKSCRQFSISSLLLAYISISSQ